MIESFYYQRLQIAWFLGEGIVDPASMNPINVMFIDQQEPSQLKDNMGHPFITFKDREFFLGDRHPFVLFMGQEFEDICHAGAIEEHSHEQHTLLIGMKRLSIGHLLGSPQNLSNLRILSEETWAGAFSNDPQREREPVRKSSCPSLLSLVPSYLREKVHAFAKRLLKDYRQQYSMPVWSKSLRTIHNFWTRCF